MITVAKTVKGVLITIPQDEKSPLLEMLIATSNLPGRKHVICQSPDKDDLERQKLLEECMQEQHRNNFRKIRYLMTDKTKWSFHAKSQTWHWKLNFEEVEELLMFLNTIRIGLWIHLGSPETTEVQAISIEQLPLLGGLHLIGVIQEEILNAID